MKILLIGKYPPMQGGISAKTYWLFKRLKTFGFEYKIITLNESDYSIKDPVMDCEDIQVIEENDVPWHIPETSLIDDQIIHSALKSAQNFSPDIVETNYLWPFCKDALLVSKLIKKPLLIRHAGSDIAKFHNTGSFSKIMSTYLNEADAIVTNHSSESIIKNLCDNHKKIHSTQRYIPNPESFKPVLPQNKCDKTFDILFAGKINYHWRYKGLELLLKVIKKNNLKALFIIGGKYKNEMEKQISDYNLEDNITIVDFVHPEQMPEMYHSCRFVWCWEETGGVDDFSNILWEALFCNTPCIVNSLTSGKIKSEEIPDSFNSLIWELDNNTLFEFDFKYINSNTDLDGQKELLFNKYIDRNLALYKNLI